MGILSRPFPVIYILGWHQCEISQKEQVNPELKAMEVFTWTVFLNVHPKLKTTTAAATNGYAFEQETLLPARPSCLRQRNVEKKECLPPPWRVLLRHGLLINLPKLTLSKSQWNFGCQASLLAPWGSQLLSEGRNPGQEALGESEAGAQVLPASLLGGGSSEQKGEGRNSPTQD